METLVQSRVETAFDPAEAEIQKAAYFLWLEEGRPVGRDLELWLTAKELLRHRTGATASPAHPVSLSGKKPTGQRRRPIL